MSLLFMNQNDKVHKLAQKVFDKQFELDEKLGDELDEFARQKMYQDVLYNISFLDVAVSLKDKKIFDNYAKWIYELLVPLIHYCPKERVMEHMNKHYCTSTTQVALALLYPYIFEQERKGKKIMVAC